jgi:hypothetical protein
MKYSYKHLQLHETQTITLLVCERSERTLTNFFRSLKNIILLVSHEMFEYEKFEFNSS